ncbi:LxmA leader domain family RiPP [Kribbella catacumbae]|nr:LxmA leader domain family RiPP [Kribbella catacumbae]
MENSGELSLMGGVVEYTTPAEVLAEDASDAPEFTPTIAVTFLVAC